MRDNFFVSYEDGQPRYHTSYTLMKLWASKGDGERQRYFLQHLKEHNCTMQEHLDSIKNHFKKVKEQDRFNRYALGARRFGFILFGQIHWENQNLF